MFLLFESVAATLDPKTILDLSPPAKATGVVLQADVGDIRYTMDNSTAPTFESGMILRTTDAPQSFLIEDLKRIKFCRGTTPGALLNVHYFAGRDI